MLTGRILDLTRKAVAALIVQVLYSVCCGRLLMEGIE
jgi:hypothetical protein